MWPKPGAEGAGNFFGIRWGGGVKINFTLCEYAQGGTLARRARAGHLF